MLRMVEGKGGQQGPDRKDGEPETISVEEVFNIIGDTVEELISAGHVVGQRGGLMYPLDPEGALCIVSAPSGTNIPDDASKTPGEKIISVERTGKIPKGRKKGQDVDEHAGVIIYDPQAVADSQAYDTPYANHFYYHNQISGPNPRPNSLEALTAIKDMMGRLKGNK